MGKGDKIYFKLCGWTTHTGTTVEGRSRSPLRLLYKGHLDIYETASGFDCAAASTDILQV